MGAWGDVEEYGYVWGWGGYCSLILLGCGGEGKERGEGVRGGEGGYSGGPSFLGEKINTPSIPNSKKGSSGEAGCEWGILKRPKRRTEGSLIFGEIADFFFLAVGMRHKCGGFFSVLFGMVGVVEVCVEGCNVNIWMCGDDGWCWGELCGLSALGSVILNFGVGQQSTALLIK